jgi:CRISPR-associated protein Cmr1
MKIKATYKIVTPMFIGDANQKATHISPASIKGMLRFWWRALNWARIKTEEPKEEKALKRLHDEEAQLFGSADGDIGQAKFLLRVQFKNNGGVHNDWPGSKSLSGYLGIGLWESGSHENENYKPAREYFSENQFFVVELLHKSDLPSETVQQLHNTLKVWGFLGGLGSRCRRGFGSVAIEDLNGNALKFNSSAEYKKAITELLAGYRLTDIGRPPFSAFCKGSQFCISNTLIANARSAHAELGKAFKNYRGQPSELRGSIKRVFGMPYAGGTLQEAEARRSSPLLFHIHPIGANFVGSVLFMPATFHSDSTLNAVDFNLASGFLKTLDKAVLV